MNFEFPMVVAANHAVSLFILAATLFALLVGVSLASRNARALHALGAMNRWLSLRRGLKPLMVPHLASPSLGRPLVLGVVVLLGASVSVYELQRLTPGDFGALLFSPAGGPLALAFAEAIRWLLLMGNGLCAVAGLLMIGSPGVWQTIERRADCWYSLRRATYPLDRMHTEFDGWVLAHPTGSGIALIVVSLGLAATAYLNWSW